MSQVLFVYMTASDFAEAERIAEALVEERLAACVNILDGMRSVFRWQGTVQKGREVAMFAKTRADLFDDLKARVVDLHSYELPCVVALPIETGHEPFLEWVLDEANPSAIV